jgi:acylphosphatase
MSLKSAILKLRDDYVVRQVARMRFPDFCDTGIGRVHILFSGKVQNVGFRYEAMLIARRLELSGTAKNRDDGCVDVEVQGSDEKIAAFVHALHSVKRFHITKAEQTNIPVKKHEKSFEIIG